MELPIFSIAGGVRGDEVGACPVDGVVEVAVGDCRDAIVEFVVEIESGV